MENLPDCMYEYRLERGHAEKIGNCIECGNAIFEGEEHFKIGEDVICEDCIIDYVYKFKVC